MKNEELGGGGWLSKRPLIKSWERLGYEQDPYNFAGGDRVIDDIRKALSTGAPTITGYGDATPLRLENLDAMMTEVLLTQSHLKLFNSIPRVTSIQPDYQWIRHVGYGNSRRTPGFREGGVPAGGVSQWNRGTVRTKFLGVKRGYTHAALITGQLGGFYNDPVASENRDGTLELLEMVERWSLWGDKDVLDENGVEVNYDGIYQQLIDDSSKSIVDLEGQPLDFSHLENASIQLTERGKLLNFNNIRTFTKPFVLSDLALLKLQAERAELRTRGIEGYRPGTPLRGYDTQNGYFPFEPSIMLDPVPDGKMLATSELGVTAAKPATTTAVAASEVTSKMVAGTYYYFSSTVEPKGETDSRASTATAVAALEKVTVTIARVTTALAYNLYRGTKSDGSDAGWIARITQPGSGDATYVDLNQIRPNCGIFLIMNMAQDDIALPQMSPLIKFPLAVIQTQQDFLLLLYHALAVKAPERIVLIKNIAKRPE